MTKRPAIGNRMMVADRGERLRRLRVGEHQLVVGLGPDAFYVVAGSQEEPRDRECHERHKKRVLNEILALLIVPKVAYQFHCCLPYRTLSFLRIGAVSSRYQR
jgi:hypothetical protein